ncbi:hypothetical protein CK203_015351 [Vitis vinifera]|uniref:Uncharacterized protein n=1 Tax=Vitis vinifera TaxID=29760 RepID=A0A438JK49_VITVI|nr:hypothetical protein CK203_015351 [Vitis vinifera]
MGGRIRRGPTPFRFENMWLKVDGFIDLLRGWWQGIEGGVWKAGSQQKFCLQQLEYWDGVESERTLTLAEAEQKKTSKDAFHHWVLLEEVHWRQKSRELWLKEGDRNTGYFHRMANAHRRNNSMDRIMINGELLTEDQAVRDGIVNEFQKLLSEEQGGERILRGCSSNNLVLGRLMSGGAFLCGGNPFCFDGDGGDKAPGPDGFSVAFWQECWDL